jgi:hypothetical protein
MRFGPDGSALMTVGTMGTTAAPPTRHSIATPQQAQSPARDRRPAARIPNPGSTPQLRSVQAGHLDAHLSPDQEAAEWHSKCHSATTFDRT